MPNGSRRDNVFNSILAAIMGEMTIREAASYFRIARELFILWTILFCYKIITNESICLPVRR